MNRLIPSLVVALAAVAGSPAARAGVSFSINIGPLAIASTPVCAPAPPVCLPAPPVVFVPPPVCVRPAPVVVYQPAIVVSPAPVFVGAPGRPLPGRGHGPYGRYHRWYAETR